MEINQLSSHGYRLSNIFDYEMLTKISDNVDSFITEQIRKNNQSFRHVCQLSGSLRTELITYLQKFSTLTTILQINKINGIELWRDYPGYQNPFHLDDQILQNIAIIYLDGSGEKNMGTGYIEDDKEYSVNYEKNTGLILLNSVSISHGMIGTVSDVNYRKVLYINWK